MNDSNNLFVNKNYIYNKQIMSSENNYFYNMNLSIHKIFNSRYSVPSKINDDEKPIIKKRRCTLSYMYEKDLPHKNSHDYLNYNFNNSITKRKKYSPNLLLYSKFSPLKIRRELRNSVDESIKKSVALRSFVNKNIKNKNNKNYEHNDKNYLDKSKAYYLNKYHEGNGSNYLNDLNNLKLHLNKNLNETYIMSNTTQSDNYFRNKNRNRDSLNTHRDTAPIYVNSESTISSFNFERENENKIPKINIDKSAFAGSYPNMLKEKYSYISNIYEQNRKENSKTEENIENIEKIIECPLKRRHSTEFAKEYEKYNYSDSHYLNKRFKDNDKIYKNKIRRHSDTTKYNSWNELYLSDIRHDANRNIFDSSLLHECNKNNLEKSKDEKLLNKKCEENDSDNPLFHTSFFKNTEEFDNNNIKRKEKIEPLDSNDEDDFVLKNDAEYVFSKRFFKDIYSNIRRKGELNFIDELLKADEEFYISTSKLNKIIENAKNKEMKYHYIDRMFLYRHAKNVIDDSDYEKYKSKCRSEFKYLDVPFPNLSEIMNLQPISNLDEIDDTDEFYDAEVKLLEKYYYKCNKEKQENTIFVDEKNIADTSIVLKKRKLSITDNESTEGISTLEKRDKLICLMNKMKREKDSFFENILDAPDFSKLLEPVFSLNESFLLSHQLFNVQYAAQLGPVVYLIKTEDENYIYRAIEVSRLFEEKVKSILDNQKISSGIKERNESYECFSNDKYPFLHELDVKYYLRIPMSTGWNHFGYLKNQNNVLFFRRPKNL
ncbi:conserved Plasmodium protein, unknown function [Plasmodium gallinaceum]|uniref:Cyclin-dependent kinases regulatory subunit n=1 Tax=Plasmodium gallinaceum TaxID=5849 RepID=A0A1J1GLR3_PLAGA|nr:conserved Plasmodium protein, unknown function [Plasmodium gallinaceum]CRG93313.1 conserved Plasmodium protein, unknown function [Plasmodium gallinaceum]